eukprot:1149321-Pelagomonas_calceolata.AAC.4
MKVAVPVQEARGRDGPFQLPYEQGQGQHSVFRAAAYLFFPFLPLPLLLNLGHLLGLSLLNSLQPFLLLCVHTGAEGEGFSTGVRKTTC